jgi:hypothetical protein
MKDDTINIFPLAFMNVFFSKGGLPEINLANVSLSEKLYVTMNLKQGSWYQDMQLCDWRF